MGQSSGSVGPAIGGSPFGGLRVLSPMDIARASPQYDPYTASRRPNYMPYGPNQQFYQPIYQPSYTRFSPMGYGQAPFGGFYQPTFQPQRFFQPMMPPPLQQQFRPIPYITQAQIDQRAAAVGGGAPVPGGMDGSGGGFGDASVAGPDSAAPDSGGYTGPGSVSGGGSPGGDGGIGLGAESSGEGVFAKGGKVRRPIYGGIDSLLRK